MTLNDKRYMVGVDLGGTNVRAAVVDSEGKIVGEARMDSKAMEGLDATVGQINATVKLAVESSPCSLGNVSAMGIGVPGTHKSAEGIVLWSPNFKDWDGIQLLDPIKQELGMPVFMGNDANVAGLGEYTYGAGRGSKVMIMFTLGTGIGSALIINGHLHLGVSETAPEMGHQIIMPDGPRCGCGRSGCLEALASRDPICFRAARKAHQGRKTLLLEMADHDLRYITPAMISKAAQMGDEISIETLQETGYFIGLGISNVINILNPDKIVIGGGIAQAGDLLFDAIRTTVEVNAIYTALVACEITSAALGDDAGVLGGAALAWQNTTP